MTLRLSWMLVVRWVSYGWRTTRKSSDSVSKNEIAEQMDQIGEEDSQIAMDIHQMIALYNMILHPQKAQSTLIISDKLSKLPIPLPLLLFHKEQQPSFRPFSP